MSRGITPVSTALPWQRAQWQQLLDRLEQGRLPHALLLAGLPGVGKEHFAMALARLLLCHRPEGGHNCGHCHGCELSRAGSHGDLLWLEPEGKSRVIKVDQIRALVEFANQTASFGARKVVLINPAESLNINAANALLKSLEEPAADTHMLLVGHRPQQIPATVRSRCQLLRLPPPPASEAVAWLEQLTGDSGHSRDLLALADGMPLRAARLLQQEGATESLLAVRELLQQLSSGRVRPLQAATALGDIELGELLEQATVFVQAELRQLSQQQLTGTRGRELLALLNELQHLRAALEAGANPNRQIFIDKLMSGFAGLLGT